MRIRWLRNLKQLLIGLLSVLVVPVIVKITQKSSWRLFAVILFCVLLVWWIRAGDDLLCDGHDVQKQICEEFSTRQISGNLCYDFCVSGLYQLSGCGGSMKHGNIRTFQVISKGEYLSDTTALVSAPRPILLRPGMSYGDFRGMVTSVLVDHLDMTPELDVLVTQLLDDFDFNRNSELSYGEAETLWRQINQPAFLNNYLFQSTGAVAHLNGSCGGLSVWHQSHPTPYLFNRQALWLLSLFYPKIYRITLPSWPKRAKVVLSLLEFAEDLMETFGSSFHLCNISGSSLYHDKRNEIVISENAQLLSGRQIEQLLSNRSCHHDHDCSLSPHCQTKCRISTQTCTGQLIRPTVAHLCDVIQDYLVFDAPKTVRRALSRQVRRCQSLFWAASHHYLVKHSIIVLDMKTILWRYIQDLKKL